MPVYIKFVRVICLVTSFLLFATVLRAQEISGRVIDAESGKPIVGANIYLNGTYQGTTSNKEGNFKISSTERNIPLIVSYVGYESQTLSNYAGKGLNILLKHKANELKEVTIGAPKDANAISREQEMEMFLHEFIGTKNTECYIDNPDDISFTYNRRTSYLTAAADKPLIIDNKKLGYKITYFLTAFRRTADEVSFQGNYFFAEDTARLKPNELKKVLRARDDAYFGSRMHFIRALWANNLVSEKFKLYTNSGGFDVVARRDEKFIRFNAPTSINYKSQTSYLKPKGVGSRETLIAANGFFDPNILWGGDMASQRVGEMLPFEFQPSTYKEVKPPVQTFGQQKINDAGLVRLLNLQDTLHKRLPVEKAYIQTDKPFYTLGDTIWLKAYLFNADYFNIAVRSGLLYIELADENANIVSRTMMPLTGGTGYGQIPINSEAVAQGSYILRAYTNWMRNFGTGYLFTKNVYITGSNNNHWLVNIKSGSSVIDGKENIHSTLVFSDEANKKVLLKEMQLKVHDSKRTLFSGKTQTDLAGMVDVNFNLPAKADAHNLNIRTEDTQDEERQMDIPLVLNRPENTDLQFMPEGGNMVAGITTKVGFKAIGENGRNVNVSGKIYNSKQEEVVAFSSLHKGMGSFILTPQSGETYTAKANLSGGVIKTYPLPAVKLNGTAISIKNQVLKVSPTGGDLEGADSLTVTISVTPELQPSTLYFTGKSREVVCYARAIQFGNNTTKTFTVAKGVFPSGIARFSLLNQQGQPLNERIVYIDHHDNLNIAISAPKKTYSARDSIALNILVTDKAGNSVQGNFSLAVTDDEQAPVDSLSNYLTTNLLLTSDLKGVVEEPGYYLQDKLQNKQALDNLMLTQGWIGYDWQQLSGPVQPIKFEAEPKFSIQGRVTKLIHTPVVGSSVTIVSAKPRIVKTMKTDAKGRFLFDDFPVTDTALFFVDATNKRGKNFGIDVAVDQIPPAEFSKPIVRYLPWFVNTDTAMQQSVAKSQKLEEEKYTGDRMLKEVDIKNTKIIKGSFNLNGPGGADQILDEKDMEKSGDMTLLALLTKNVKGFIERFYPNGAHYYQIGGYRLRLFIDGDPVPSLFPPTYGTKYYMDNLTAKTIKGIEVMDTYKHMLKYSPGELVSAIEVTTKAGTGPNIEGPPGTYEYRPVQWAAPKQFYRPKYTAKALPGETKDFRSTINWQPNITTNAQGRALVTFYASDHPNNYTVVVEGSDMNGNIGSVVKKLTTAKSTP